MKKIIALSAAGALLIAVVVPVLALDVNDSEFLIRSNVRSRIRATSNTGDNVQTNSGALAVTQSDNTTHTGSNTGTTGLADAAAFSTTAVNSTSTPLALNGDADLDEVLFTSRARVRTYTSASANSGRNTQTNTFTAADSEMDDLSIAGTNTLTTGDAISTADSLTVVNSSWSGAAQ